MTDPPAHPTTYTNPQVRGPDIALSPPRPIETGEQSDNANPERKKRCLDNSKSPSTPFDYVYKPTIAPDISTITKEVLGEKIQDALLHCYSGGTFKSSSQEKLIWACLQGESTLAILPTGAGKSSAYYIPPLVTDAVTVAIIPFKWILQQALKNAQGLGIKVVEWV